MKPCAKVLCGICQTPIVAMSEESMKAACYDHLCFAHARIRPAVKGDDEPARMARAPGGDGDPVCTAG